MLDAMDEIEGGGVKSEKSIVCWQPHGKAFMVHKPKDFVTEVMPHFFNQTKYASFQRQLNLYGFSRLTHGPDKGAYYHNCFVRGQRHLCKGMVRQKIKGTKVRKSLSPEDEPNFYIEDHNRAMLTSTFCQQQQQHENSSSVQQSHDDDNNHIISPDSVKSLKSSSPRINMISSEDSLVSLIPIIPSNYPNNMKTPSTSTANNSSLHTILNTIYSSEGMGTTTGTTTGLSSSTTTSSSSSSLLPSNSRSDYFPPDIIMNTIGTISPLPRNVSPHNRTVSFDNHRQQKQVYPAPVTLTEVIKGGDLLFFEGQPFRYLEHFEEVPHRNNTCNNDKKKNENNIMMKRQMMILKSKRSNYSSTSSSSPVQATRDTTNTVTDKFHDMISNIMLNIDSSSSLSPPSSSSSPRPFQDGLHQMQNTSCPV